jgi:ATP-binding cassette subfamily B protein
MSTKKTIQSIPTNPWAFTWFAVTPNRLFLYLGLVGITVATLIHQITPYLYKLVVDAVERGDVALVPFYLGLYPVSFFLIQMFYRAAGYCVAQVCIKGKEYLYNQLSSYLLKHSKDYFADRLAGSVMTKISTAANAYESFLEFVLWNYLDAFVTFASALVFISLISPTAGVVTAITFAVLFTLNYVSISKGQKLSAASADAQSKQSGALVDIMSNNILVRQFGQEAAEQKRISLISSMAKSAELNIRLFGEWMLIKSVLVITIGFGALMYVMVTEWQLGETTTGSLVFVLGLLLGMAYQLLFLGNAFQNGIQQFGQLRDSIKDILVTHTLVDSADACQLKISDGSFHITDANFAYGTQTVFDNFSLTISGGQKVGLVGKSGAGKSTLISLILREYDIQSGSIKIDDQDIKVVTQASLRNEIAVVPQEPMLFHRSIKENIAYAKPDATLEEIVEVAKKAYVDEFVSVLPERYDTLVGERGVKLSGGQKQRIAIARAMLKNAPILILDEATSALDSESEIEIQKALHSLMVGKTVIAVAHRLSTLREMDRIIVLENGKIVEDGSHDALLEFGGVYSRLWQQQAGGFIVD